MVIQFRSLTLGALKDFAADVPPGAIIGLTGSGDSGARELLRAAGGVDAPLAGTVEPAGRLRYRGPAEGLGPGTDLGFALDHALCAQDPVEQFESLCRLSELRRAGTSSMILSSDAALLAETADEVWWLDDGRLRLRADPREALDAFAAHCAGRIRAAAGTALTLAPRFRRGDGRARVVALDLFGEDGAPTTILKSGEQTTVRVELEFAAAVEQPVVGILIRTRVGLNVYGTNTELEGLALGPRAAGDRIAVEFRFACGLCPLDYSITVASHDPDGVWHDWLEEAAGFRVVDSRYTAGVANLRAQVRLLNR